MKSSDQEAEWPGSRELSWDRVTRMKDTLAEDTIPVLVLAFSYQSTRWFDH